MEYLPKLYTKLCRGRGGRGWWVLGPGGLKWGWWHPGGRSGLGVVGCRGDWVRFIGHSIDRLPKICLLHWHIEWRMDVFPRGPI